MRLGLIDICLGEVDLFPHPLQIGGDFLFELELGLMALVQDGRLVIEALEDRVEQGLRLIFTLHDYKDVACLSRRLGLRRH